MDIKNIKIGDSDPNKILFGKYKVQKANSAITFGSIIPKDNSWDAINTVSQSVWQINDGWEVEVITPKRIAIKKFKIDTWGLRQIVDNPHTDPNYNNLKVNVEGLQYVHNNVICHTAGSNTPDGFTKAFCGSSGYNVKWYPGQFTNGSYIQGMGIQFGVGYYANDDEKDDSLQMGKHSWDIGSKTFITDGTVTGTWGDTSYKAVTIGLFGGVQNAASWHDETGDAYKQYDISDHPIYIDLDVDDLTQPVDPTSVECWDAYCGDTPLYHKDKTVDNCWKNYGLAIPKDFNITKKGLSSNDYIEWISPLKFKVKGVPSAGISISTSAKSIDANYTKLTFVPFGIKIHNKPTGVSASVKRTFSNITTSEDVIVPLSDGENTVSDYTKTVYRSNSSSNIGYTECIFTFSASSNIEDSFTVEIVPDFRGKPIYKVDFSEYELISGATADEFVAEDHKIMFKNPKAGETTHYTFAASPAAYENGAIATLKTTGLGSVMNEVNILMSAEPIGSILQIDKIYNNEQLTWDGRTEYKNKTTIGVVGGEGRTITIEELPTYEDPDIISLNTDIWNNILSSLIVPETVDMEDYMDKILWNIKPANTSIWDRVKAWYETHDAPLLTGQFSNSRGLEEITLNLRKNDVYLYCNDMMNDCDIKKIVINCPKSSKIASLNNFFRGAYNLNNIVANLVDDEENGDANIKAAILPTDISGAFDGCHKLETYPADLINWYNPYGNILGETMPCTLIAYAFEYCYKLKTIPSFDYEAAGYPESANIIRSTRYASQAFMDCTSLESIGPTLDLILVTSNYKMFQNCNALTSAKIKNLNHIDWDFTDTLKALDEYSVEYLFSNLVDLTTHDAEKHEDTIDKSFKNWNSRYWTEYQTNPNYPVIFTNVRTAVCRKITQSYIYIASTDKPFDSMNLTIYGLDEYNAGQDNEAAKIIVKQGNKTIVSRTTDGSFSITNPNGKNTEIILNATSIADRTPYIQIVITNGLDFSNPIADHANLKCPAEWGEHQGVSKFDFASNMTKSTASTLTADTIIGTVRQAPNSTTTLAWSTTKPVTIKFKVEGLVDGDTLGIGEGGANSSNLSNTPVKVTEDGVYTFTVDYDSWGFKLWNNDTSVSSAVTITSLEEGTIPSKITGAMVADANAKGWTVYVDNEIVTPNTFKDDKVFHYDIAKQKATNESLTANPVLEDLSFKYKNVDWRTFQNYNGLGDNRGTIIISDKGHSMTITQVDGINSLIEVTPSIVASVPMKVTVTGIPEGATLRYRYETSINASSPNATEKIFRITEDGDYILPYSNVACKYNMAWSVTGFTGECNITITQRVAHDMQLHNFTFGGLSGVGTTAVNRLSMETLYKDEVTIDGLKVHIDRMGSTASGTYVCRVVGSSNFRIKVSNRKTNNPNATNRSMLSINAYRQTPFFNEIVQKLPEDGIYDIDITKYNSEPNISIYISCYADTVADIEILPYYENALVFNGTAPKYVYNFNNIRLTNIINAISYNKGHISVLPSGFRFNSSVIITGVEIAGNVGESLTIDIPAFYVRVTGLEDGYTLWFGAGYKGDGSSFTWEFRAINISNGVTKIPAYSKTIEPLDENSTPEYIDCRIGVSRIDNGTLTEDLPVDITIEFLPIYDAATTTMYADIPNIPLNKVKTMIMDFVPLSDNAGMWYYSQRGTDGYNFALVNKLTNNGEIQEGNVAYDLRNNQGTYINGELNTTRKALSLLQERHTVAVKSADNNYSGIYIGYDSDNDVNRHQQMALYSLIGFDRVLDDSEIQYWSDKLLKQHKDEEQ